MILDLSSFKKAATSFKEAIDEYNKDRKNLFVRDSVIQRFEYTYSLALKMIKRYIEISTEENTDDLTFNNLIRTANEKGLLLTNLEVWNSYRLKRNLTSHVYDEQKADDVISVTEEFYKDIIFLLNELEKRNDNQ